MNKKITIFTMLVLSIMGLSINSFAQTTDLIISEYAEGSSNNKYIEIYNGTGSSVDLSDYEMWKISNGGAWPENTMSLSGTLANGATYVMAHSSSSATILAAADTAFSSSIVYFNGDDAIGLAKDNGTGTFELIDAVGTWGPDPGSGWDVAGTTNGTGEHTLVRKDTVCSPDTTWTVTSGTTIANSQWIVYAQDTWTDIGMHTSTCSSSGPTSADSTKPEVIDGNFASAISVTVTFSEPVTSATAQNTANYSMTPGISVTSAVLSASMDSVTLTLSPGLLSGTMYTVDIINVTDTSSNANVMDPFNTTFYFNDYSNNDIQITEINYAQTSSGIQDIDYFEVYNSGTAAVSLAGMELTSGMDLSIDSNVVLAAGAYLVFTENLDSFNLAFPSVANVIGVEGGSLSGGGETITLSNTIGTSVASVTYDNAAPWPNYSDMASIELCDLSTNYMDGENWYYAGTVSSSVGDMIYGTPGSANSCAAPPVIPTYAIEVIRTVDVDGVADSLDVYCAVEGIVHGVDLDGNNGISFFIVDDTRGINIFNYNDVDGYVVTEGDEIRVVGEVAQYNGLIELFADSITVLSTGNCIQFPEVVNELNEDTESEYIEFKNVTMVDPGQWPAPGSSANMEFVTANGDTLNMRLDADTDVQDSILSAPSGTFNLIGLGSQYDNSSPYFDGYQIFPMYVTDFDSNEYAAPANFYINEIAVTNASTHDDGNGNYYQWIEIFNEGVVDVDLTGYFFSTDSTDVFESQLPRCNNNLNMGGITFELFYADADDSMGERYIESVMTTANPYIGLYTPNGTLVHSLSGFGADLDTEGNTFGQNNNDHTRPLVVFTTGTPGASNGDGVILSVINAASTNALNAYPNPVSNGTINFNKSISFTVYSITGQTILSRENVNKLDVSHLNNGIYLIETNDGEVIRMVVR